MIPRALALVLVVVLGFCSRTRTIFIGAAQTQSATNLRSSAQSASSSLFDILCVVLPQSFMSPSLSSMTISTRRFSWRPLAESFDERGCDFPSPCLAMISAETPAWKR